MRRGLLAALSLVLALATLLAQQPPPPADPPPPPTPSDPPPTDPPPPTADPSTPASPFVRADGTRLILGDAPFVMAGSNNYFAAYSTNPTVDSLFDTAAANGMNTLRVWGAFDIGNQDGSNSVAGKANGVYFHYWDGAAPAFNDGPDGLEKLDYVIWKAGQSGVRLIIPFVNNWRDFGGMDQYVRWAGAQYHDDFYSNPVIRQWYKDWIAHLLNRVNPLTGLAYKDDPAILMWELANEPRCKGSGVYPQSKNCTTATLIEWAADVSAHIKSIDANHLTAVGDEGFYCNPGSRDWLEACGEGVDNLGLAAVSGIDVLSFHMYPLAWGKDADWGTAWIRSHFENAKTLNKPALLGEFGFEDGNRRTAVYKTWTDMVLTSGGNGALFWMLSTRSDFGGYDVQCPNEVCTLVNNFSQMLKAGAPLDFPPVAGEKRLIADFETPAVSSILDNSAVYGTATLDPTAVDLDPTQDGLQTLRTMPGGAFELQPEGQVKFTPDPGFEGKLRTLYTLTDSNGAISQPAPLQIQVNARPGDPYTLFSFETDTEGWAPASWQTPDSGALTVSTEFSSHGTQSLKITAGTGGWFGVSVAPLDLSKRSAIEFDIRTTDHFQDVNSVIQAGSSYLWCQQPDGRAAANSTTTRSLDLTKLTCANPDLSKVQTLFIQVSAGNTIYLDRIRVR